MFVCSLLHEKYGKCGWDATPKIRAQMENGGWGIEKSRRDREIRDGRNLIGMEGTSGSTPEVYVVLEVYVSTVVCTIDSERDYVPSSPSTSALMAQFILFILFIPLIPLLLTPPIRPSSRPSPHTTHPTSIHITITVTFPCRWVPIVNIRCTRYLRLSTETFARILHI